MIGFFRITNDVLSFYDQIKILYKYSSIKLKF